MAPAPAPAAPTALAPESTSPEAARALLRAKMREADGRIPSATTPPTPGPEAAAAAKTEQTQEKSPRRKLTRAESQKSSVAAARRSSVFHKPGAKERQVLARNAAEPDAAQPAAPKTKRQKLAELLERYKADKITPIQYHEERAKIVAEP